MKCNLPFLALKLIWGGLMIVFFFGMTPAIGQTDFSSNYSLSFGTYRQNQLTNLNEQLLNDGFRPISLIGTAAEMGINQSLNTWSIEAGLNLFTTKNKTKNEQTAITLNNFQVVIALGKDLLKSDKFDLIPFIGIGIGSSNLAFAFTDTASSFNAVLGGYATKTELTAGKQFIVNPKLRFAFRGAEERINEGYFVDFGYFAALNKLKWSLPDVSFNQLSGLYFKFGLMLPISH